MSSALHPMILKQIEDSKGNGLDISKLETGIKLKVFTKNTEYNLEKISNDKYLIQGGNYFPFPVECYISGSTWGGSMIKLNWIGKDMHMEIYSDSLNRNLNEDVSIPRGITTSSVQRIIIIGKDYEYEL